MTRRRAQRTIGVALALFLFTLPLLMVPGCSTEEEPRYNNMPVSIHLKRIVTSDREREVETAQQAVASIGKPAVPYVEKAWQEHPEVDARCRLATVIHDLGPAAAPLVPLLQEALATVDEQLISCAAYALGGIGPAAAPAAQRLGELLRSSDSTTQVNLLYALGGIGPEAAGQLSLVQEAALRDRTRGPAIEALGLMGPAAVEALREWLISQDVEKRLIASEALALSGGGVADVLPDLVTALQDADPRIRRGAAQAIARARADALAVESDLIAALADQDEEVQRHVQSALAAIGPENRGGLIAALNHPNSQVREGAARVIGRSSTLVHQARESLIRRLEDPNVHVRLAAIDALAVAGAEIIPEMLRQLKSQSSLRRFAGARVLGEMGSKADVAVPELRKLLHDTDSIVRKEAAAALKKIR